MVNTDHKHRDEPVAEGWPEPLSEFSEGQWWIKELDALKDLPGASNDQKRAVAVVHHLLASVDRHRRGEPVGAVPQEAPSDEDRQALSALADRIDSAGGNYGIEIDVEAAELIRTLLARSQQPVSGADELPEGVKQFTKKAVTINAIQWTGENLREVIEFTGKHPRWSEWFTAWEDYERHVRQDGRIFKIFTLEGTMEATPGDWIIRGIKGEQYPCKPEIFAATYEPAQPQSSGNAGELPEALIPAEPDLEYLRSMADGDNLPAMLRGNILAAVRAIGAAIDAARQCKEQP